ncbi:hypothetical protein GGF40_002653 [Coemansia sp. RSA 1286]|nr:hypothetical protein GGF40_002653 [Coemansia sp. RSA 1286]
MQGFSGNIHTSPYTRRTPASGSVEAHRSAIGGNGNNISNSNANVHSSRYSQIVIKEPNTAEPKKAKRKRITPEQLKELTSIFEKTDTPTHDIREELSKKLNMTNREVQVWFQNRRAKYNRMRIEHQRQIRNNAAIIYNAGMITRTPVAAVPPHSLPQHQQQIYQQPPMSPPVPMPMAPGPSSAPVAVPVPSQTQMHAQPLPQSHSQTTSSPHYQSFAAAPSRYASGNPTFVRRSSLQQLHSHQIPHPHAPSSRNRSCSSDILPTDAYGHGMSPVTATITIVPPRSPPKYSPPLPGHSVAYTPPATASVADADVSGVQTRFLAPDGTLLFYQQPLQQQHYPRFETSVPVFTPASATSAHLSSNSAEVTGFLPRSSNSPYSQRAPELTPDCAYNPDSQQLASPRAPGAFPQVGRRNTVSSYQSTSCNSRHAPLPDCSVVASPPPPGVYRNVAEARSRYMPKMPASGYHYHHRLSTNRSQSPPTSHYRHYAQHNHAHLYSNDHYFSSPAAVSNDSMQVQPAMPTCQSAIADAPVSGREVRLPSIKAILAETSEGSDHSNGKSNGKSNGSDSSAPTNAHQDSDRLHSYTSLPTAHAEAQPAQPVAGMSASHADTRAESAAQVTSSSSHAQCYQDSQIIEAKMGIDVLATAAISVSSIKNSISLPHLTPLSEFALRNAAQQQHCLTAPASPRQSQDERPPLPPSSKSREGTCPESRSQRVTPTNSREKTPHGWRPW